MDRSGCLIVSVSMCAPAHMCVLPMNPAASKPIYSDERGKQHQKSSQLQDCS